MKRVLRIAEWFHPDGFPISIERRDPQEEFGAHGHEFAELVIVTGGKGLHLSGGDSWELTAGDVLVIGGNRTHAYRDLRDLRLVNILHQPAQLALQLGDLPGVPGYHALFRIAPGRRVRQPARPRIHLKGRDFARTIELTGRLEEELAAREPGFGFMATALFMQLIGHLSRCCGRAPSPDNRALLRVGEAISHLEQHLRHAPDLDDLARIARMSRRSFLRVFRSATGSPPLAWLIERRIERACSLLRHTDLTVTEIAFDCGFNDSNYFSRQFRKVTGGTPRDYRKRLVR